MGGRQLVTRSIKSYVTVARVYERVLGDNNLGGVVAKKKRFSHQFFHRHPTQWTKSERFLLLQHESFCYQ